MLGSKCKAKNVSFYRSLNKEERESYNKNPSRFMKKYNERNLSDDMLEALKKIKRLQNKILKKDEEIKRLKSKLNKSLFTSEF